VPPKKAKELVKPTAEKLDLSIEFVKDVIDFYWMEVRKSLSELRAPRVVVANFGSFQIKTSKIADQKKKYEEQSDYYKPEAMTFQKHKIKEDVDLKLSRINKIIETIEYDSSRKKQIREKRYAKETKNNLEESQGDISGNKE
jgi:nucleoid DNA-binding protein